jgi:hypothetical protein
VYHGDAMREATPGELEQLRRAHFNTENNIKLLGIAVMLCAFALLLIGVETSDNLSTQVLFAVLGGGLGLGGWWLRRLDLRGRGIYTGAMVLALLGTLRAWFLGEAPVDGVWDLLLWPLLALGLVVWSNKATTVMSAHYRDVVIPATPQVQHRVSPKFVFAMFLMLLVIAASIFAAAIE